MDWFPCLSGLRNLPRLGLTGLRSVGDFLCGGPVAKKRETFESRTGEFVCTKTIESQDGQVLCVATKNGLLCTGSDDKKIRLYRSDPSDRSDYPASERSDLELLDVLSAHTRWVMCVEFFAFRNKNLLASGGSDGSLIIFDLSDVDDPNDPSDRKTGRIFQHFPFAHSDCLKCILTPKPTPDPTPTQEDSVLITGGCDWKIRVWDLNTLECLHTLKGHRGSVNSLARLDRNRIASCGDDKSIRLWNPSTGESLQTICSFSEPRNMCMVFVPDLSNSRGIVCTGGIDGTIKLWDIETGRKISLAEKHNGFVLGMAVIRHRTHPTHPSQNPLVASVGLDKTIKIWDLTTGVCVQTLTSSNGPKGHNGPNGSIGKKGQNGHLGSVVGVAVDAVKANANTGIEYVTIFSISTDKTLKVWTQT